MCRTVRVSFIVCFLLIVMCPIISYAQTGNMKDSNIMAYIEKHKDIAMDEMLKSGIPASIKLAQGIVETDAGTSVLVMKSNNHFGIKCKRQWQGDKVYHDDDAKGECFRKYEDVFESYADHSDFLASNTRYAKAFATDPLDYKQWAIELKNAGYATNPKYVGMLTKIVEDFGLQAYTLTALKRASKLSDAEYETLNSNLIFNKRSLLIKESLHPNSTDSLAPLLSSAQQSQGRVDSLLLSVSEVLKQEYLALKSEPKTEKMVNNIQPLSFAKSINLRSLRETMELEQEIILTHVHNLKAIQVEKGTSLLFLAIKYNIDFDKLLAYNDFTHYANLTLKAQYIYLEAKNESGTKEYHIVKENETLYDIAQEEGVKLEQLRKYNFIAIGVEPKANQKVYLMYRSPEKVQTYAVN